MYFQSLAPASAFWRCVVPALALNSGSKVVAHLSSKRIPREALEHDVIVFQLGHDGMTRQYASALQNMGKKIVFELDDDLLSLEPWHQSYEAFKSPAAKDALKSMLGLADVVTVSTKYLCDTYAPYCKRIETLVNCLPLADWPKSEPHGTEEFRVLWAGSPSHLGDLAVLAKDLEEFALRHENVRIHLIGRDVPGLERVRSRVTVEPFSDFGEYPVRLAAAKADVALAPLADIEFNKSKSNIKLLEYAATGYPIIASDIGPYHDTITSGESGILVKTNWLDALELVYGHLNIRNMLRQGGSRLAESYDISRRVFLFENFFASLV